MDNNEFTAVPPVDFTPWVSRYVSPLFDGNAVADDFGNLQAVAYVRTHFSLYR